MLANYIKTALKVLARRKFFTFITLFAITFTLVVLIVSAAMLDFAFGSQRPETRNDRIVGAYAMGSFSEHWNRTGFPGYRTLHEHLPNLPGVERTSIVSVVRRTTSYLDGRAVKFWAKSADGEFWKIYDFEFIEGGPYTNFDEAQANRVAVINRASREHFFGGQSALGRHIDVDGQNYRIVGVVENVPATRFTPFADVWTPVSTSLSSDERQEYVGGFFGIVLARDKASIPALQREFNRRVASIHPAGTEATEIHGGLETQFEGLSRVLFSPRLEQSHPNILRMIILALMFLFAMLPAVNLMNIGVSRAFERSGEIGVRKAFGASSWTLVGQFVTENVIVTLIGGLISLFAAEAILLILNHSSMILYGNFHLNWRIFLYGFVISLTFGLMTSLYPAWRMSRLHPVEALRGRHS